MYCCNTRISYLLRLASLRISSAWTVQCDEAFACVFRRVLHFPLDSQDPLVSPSYDNALEQLRLLITKGGFGLASAEATAPGGLYSAVVGFVCWHAKRNFGSGSCCRQALGEGGFPYFLARIDECCASLDEWGLLLALEPAEAGSDFVIWTAMVCWSIWMTLRLSMMCIRPLQGCRVSG